MGALGAAQAQKAVGVNCAARDARLARQGRLPAPRIGLTRDRPPLDDVDRIDFLFPRAFAGGGGSRRTGSPCAAAIISAISSPSRSVSAGWPIAPSCPFLP